MHFIERVGKWGVEASGSGLEAVAVSYEHGNEPWCFIRGGNFLTS